MKQTQKAKNSVAVSVKSWVTPIWICSPPLNRLFLEHGFLVVPFAVIPITFLWVYVGFYVLLIGTTVYKDFLSMN